MGIFFTLKNKKYKIREFSPLWWTVVCTGLICLGLSAFTLAGGFILCWL
jgi:hypothetical protein